MIAACVSPMTEAEVPWWRSASVTVKIAPVKAKLMSGAWMSTALSRASRQIMWMPFKASIHNPPRCSSVGVELNFPVIRHEVSTEMPYETVSPMKGTARPSPNRTPPSAGPPSLPRIAGPQSQPMRPRVARPRRCSAVQPSMPA